MTGQSSNVYEAADSTIDETFKFPHKPGTEPPPVESTVLLILAEYLWYAFGRQLLICEIVFAYAPFLGLLTYVTVSRGTTEDSVQDSMCVTSPHSASFLRLALHLRILSACAPGEGAPACLIGVFAATWFLTA